jgi:hypothetical protein
MSKLFSRNATTYSGQFGYMSVPRFIWDIFRYYKTYLRCGVVYRACNKTEVIWFERHSFQCQPAVTQHDDALFPPFFINRLCHMLGQLEFLFYSSGPVQAADSNRKIENLCKNNLCLKYFWPSKHDSSVPPIQSVFSIDIREKTRPRADALDQ